MLYETTKSLCFEMHVSTNLFLTCVMPFLTTTSPLCTTSTGTNNARVTGLLRQLAEFYSKEANHLFVVRIAQGLVAMGKGLLSISPFHSDR